MTFQIKIVDRNEPAIRDFIEQWRDFIDATAMTPIGCSEHLKVPEPNVEVIKNSNAEMRILRDRVTQELGWHVVTIPSRLSGDAAEIKERVEFCQEQFGPCAMARQGRDFTFDADQRWVAFQATSDTKLVFMFKDINEATLFRIARG